MRLFESLRGGVLGRLETAALPAVISPFRPLWQKQISRNLQGLVAQLQQARLDKQAQSWLGNGPE